ncbi:MAG TPA: hypothetical protein VMJ10_32050 [Kofleriaceae bacterium]|nr:hypothetical protein [Kofleriaceae bacterium]
MGVAVRFRPIAIACVGIIAIATSAHAFGPHSGAHLAADSLTALPGAHVAKAVRVQRTIRWAQPAPSPAWSHFQAIAGGTWQAGWDAATGVPVRIWGSGIAAPGANADPAIAEAFARAILLAHVGLLAPGATASDFQLVSNTSDGDIRSVGFVQLAGGVPVIGGQIGFEFKRDRLFVIGSTALPNVVVVAPRARLAPADLRSRAAASLRALAALPLAPASQLGGDEVLPLVADDTVLGYRLVSALEVDGRADGRYRAYADVASGELVAVQQLDEFATGTVRYNGVDRYPGNGYTQRLAPQAQITVNGAAQTTTGAGAITWSPDTTAQVVTSTTGDYVVILNQGTTMTQTTATLAIDPGGEVLWDASMSPEDDAQIDAYLDTNIVKSFVYAHIDPNMPTLLEPMKVYVNEDNTCNAFFDGANLNFFEASPSPCDPTRESCCENTARIQDVNFHEYGHRVHTAEIIAGVGAFDGAMSEGAADTLAVNITNDSGMGRGFYRTSAPLRELNPPGMEYTWPNDIGEIHHTGLIFGGTFWDLRAAAIAAYGYDAGEALLLGWYLGALRRAVDIPTCLIEVLAADDDDGDLSNGTPHECMIRAAFGAHGMRTASGWIEAPGTLDEPAHAVGIAIEATGLSSHCPSDGVAGATLAWRSPIDTSDPGLGSAAGTPAGANRWFAELPVAQNEAVQYTAFIQFGDGTSLQLADNLADHYYQLYHGHTVPLYCTNFEDGDPLAAGWTAGTDDGSPPGWAWAVPSGGITNPHAAYSGTHILAQAPNGDYPASQHSWIELPPIDTGHYSDVRLQYRRWLAVQDSQFDQAQILANGSSAWENATENMGGSSAFDHIDQEWRFHDVPLSGEFHGSTLNLRFDLKSDGGTQFAGWSIDDLCVVANPLFICGDGVTSRYEQCDDGSANADVADACRTDCRKPACGDGIVDTGEACDDGSGGSKTCTAKCTAIPPTDSGGCSASGAGTGSCALVLVIGAVVRRRRGRSPRSARACMLRAPTCRDDTAMIGFPTKTSRVRFAAHCYHEANEVRPLGALGVRARCRFVRPPARADRSRRHVDRRHVVDGSDVRGRRAHQRHSRSAAGRQRERRVRGARALARAGRRARGPTASR